MKHRLQLNILATVLALSSPFSSLSAHAADLPAIMHAAAQRDHVVFQVSDAAPEKWNLALNNAKNVQEGLGKDNVDIEIVVYGPGIDMLKLTSEVGKRVDKAIAEGVKIVACENTMKTKKLTKADILPTVTYVPGGVLELMKRQKEGWAYIRP